MKVCGASEIKELDRRDVEEFKGGRMPLSVMCAHTLYEVLRKFEAMSIIAKADEEYKFLDPVYSMAAGRL